MYDENNSNDVDDFNDESDDSELPHERGNG